MASEAQHKVFVITMIVVTTTKKKSQTCTPVILMYVTDAPGVSDLFD